jgi:carboxypeptidase T
MHPLPLVRLVTFALLVALVAPLGTPHSQAASDRFLMRVYFGSAAQRDRLLATLDVPDHAVQPEGYLLAYGNQALLNRLRSAGQRAEIDPARTRAEFSSAAALFDQDYRTVEEIYADLAAAVAAHPGLAAIVDAGDSWCKTQGGCSLPSGAPIKGYDLRAIHITNQAIAGPKPVAFWIAAHHAREIHTPEIALRYIHWLLDNYGSDADATWLVDYHDIWVIPLGNPDAHKVVESGGNYPIWQRKNLNVIDSAPWSICGTSPNYQSGIDLNRNHDFHWRSPGGGWSEGACSETFPGPVARGPASEPELQGYTALVDTLLADQRGPGDEDPAPATTTGIFVSIHSGTRWILIPYDWRPALAPNNPDLEAVWDKVATWTPGWPSCSTGACYGLVAGSASDWAYGKYGVAAAVWEIGEFMPQYAEIDAYYWPFLRPMMIYTTRIARAPYLEARGPDALRVVSRPQLIRPGGPPLTITATIDDTQNGQQPIVAAEMYVDLPPWAGGVAVPMAADDGSFDTVAEPVHAALDVCALAPGRHLVFIRGKDSAGYWGPLFAAFAGLCSNQPQQFLPIARR